MKTNIFYVLIFYSLILSSQENQKINLQEKDSINNIERVIEMDEIIISVPFHKLQSENVMKVEKLNLSDFKREGSVTLSDGISNFEGVQQMTTGLGIGKPVIRGLTGNRVLMYAQGVRLENQQFGSEHGLGLSDSGIESVELIKGPASLLYGSDAMGGILYFNLEKFAEVNNSQTSINSRFFSNTIGFSNSFGSKFSKDKFKFLIRGFKASHADYKTQKYRITNTRFEEEDFKFGVGYQNESVNAEFRYNYNNFVIGIPEEILGQTKTKVPVNPYQSISNQIISIKSTFIFDNSSLDLTIGNSSNNRREFEGHDEEEHEEDKEGTALNMKLETITYDIKYHFPESGKFETILGSQGMSQKNSNFGDEILVPDAIKKDFGIFTVSDVHFNDFDLQFGIRFDNRKIEIKDFSDRNFSSFNMSFGLKKLIFQQTIFRINLATGFRAPNLAELTSNGIHHGAFRFEIGNINLNKEHNFQSDVSIEFKTTHIDFSINGFQNSINNYIYLSPTGENIYNFSVFEYLQNNANLYGGEMSLDIHPHPLDWLHLETSFESVTGKLNDGKNLPLIPANSLKQTIRVDFGNSFLKNQYLQIKYQFVFTQNRVSFFESKSDNYNLLSSGFGGEIILFENPLQINISGTNLTNEKYIDHLSRLKNNSLSNIGRNIIFGLNYTF